MPACTLSDFPSWITCAQTGVPFTEVVTLVVFFVFFLFFGVYPMRERLIASFFIALFVSGAFYGMNLINPVAPLICLIGLALSWALLHSQNSG